MMWLEKLINIFEHQVDTFILHQSSDEDYPISSLGDYDEFDNSDVPPDSIEDGKDTQPFLLRSSKLMSVELAIKL